MISACRVDEGQRLIRRKNLVGSIKIMIDRAVFPSIFSKMESQMFCLKRLAAQIIFFDLVITRRTGRSSDCSNHF